jgi:hypothetical protein
MNPLDKFGKFMVENLRDRALEQNQMLLNGDLRGQNIQELQSRIASLPAEQRELIARLAKDLIDTAMHDILYAFQDAHDRDLGIEVTVDGANVADESGMLNGEHLGSNGWIDRFSKFV